MSRNSFRGDGPDAKRRILLDNWQHNLALDERPEPQHREPRQFYVVRRPTITDEGLESLRPETQSKFDAQSGIKRMLHVMADPEGDSHENYERNANEIRGVLERLGYSFNEAVQFVHAALQETGVVLTKRRHIDLVMSVIPREYPQDEVAETVRMVGAPQLRLLPDCVVELDEDPEFVAEMNGDEVVHQSLLKLEHDARRYQAAAANGHDFLVNWELWQALDIKLPYVAPAEESCFHLFREEEFNALDSDEAVEAYCQQLLREQSLQA